MASRIGLAFTVWTPFATAFDHGDERVLPDVDRATDETGGTGGTGGSGAGATGCACAALASTGACGAP
jgi:hypothetical protein